LVGLCHYVLAEKSCDQEFTLCFFLGINFHCLILEHVYAQGHIKNIGNLMMLKFKTICNVCLAVFLDVYSVCDATFAALSNSLKNSAVFLQI
jgi:hypothetical protein